MANTKFISRTSAIAAQALEVARKEIGVMEVPLGSNNGPKVRQYLSAVGLPPGYAWCMAFVYWCFNKVPDNPVIKTGGVLHFFNNATGKRLHKIDAKKTPLTPAMILPGDIFIMAYAGGTGHTGFVEKVTGDSIMTIEGNTNNGGSREGVGVYARRRKISELRGIVRVLDEPTNQQVNKPTNQQKFSEQLSDSKNG